MSKKSEKTTVITFKSFAITTCLITIFLPSHANSVEPELAEVNNNLQAIFKRIKQKTAAHDAQQAELAAQAEAAKTAQTDNSPRQTFDSESLNTTESNFSDATAPETDNESRFAAGEELILTTSVNNQELASIFAFKTDEGLQIGLGDFFQIVELAIYVDLEQASAEGWYQNEKNRFNLTRQSDGNLKVNVGNSSYVVTTNQYRLEEDLFVELDEIARWFNLSYELNEERLALAITAKDKLPVELRLARQNKKGVGTSLTNKSVMPLQDSDYQLFSSPMLDIQTSAQETERVIQPLPSAPADEEPTKDRTTSASYSILASSDLAYFTTELFLAGNKEDELSNAWLTMSRQSDEGDLLGPLRATEYAFGDVTPVNAGFGSTQSMSRGFSLGNTPINQLADNRKVNITGEIQVGWDVELYRNGVLIDQRLGVSEGRYEFNDTPLEYGNNDFELMFYGPQGQIETKTESYIVDSNTVTSGQGMYRFSLVEVGESVFNIDPYLDDPTQQGTMASTVLDYGITDWLALSAGSSVFEPKLGETQQFITLGANASFGKIGLFSAQFLQDKDDLQSTDYNFRTRVLDTNYSFNYRTAESITPSVVDPSVLEVNNSDEINLAMSGQLFHGSWLPISYQNSWYRLDQKEQNTRDERFQNTLGIGSRLGYFSNSLVLQKDAEVDPTLDPDLVPAPEEDSINGNFQYRKNFGRFHTRLFSSYGVKPTNEVFSYGGAFNYNWSQDLNSELRYAYYTLADKYQINAGLNWRKDAFYLNTNVGYNEDGSWSAGVGLRFSLGYEPLGQSVFTSNRPIAQSGAVAVRVFEDLNMNGTFDENEPPMENATVKAVQAYRQDQTNDAGVAVLSSLYNNTTTDIVVDEATLDGPFMITAIPGVAIKARKGFVDKVDLPVVKAGEVEGVIYLKDKNGSSNPAAYIMINLVDKNGKVVATTRSEYDGYYLFTKVKPGSYQLKVDEDYIDRRGLKVDDKQLNFSSNGDVIEGADFVLLPLDEAKGYVATAGKFESPAMLKLYYHILRRKMGGYFVQKPFYIKLPNKGGFVLGIAYYPSPLIPNTQAERNARKACDALTGKDIYCDVEYFDFKY